MKVKSILSCTVVLICTAALAGCAFASEKITLNPTVNVAKQNIGHEKLIAVQVIDSRASTSIGGRASGYGPAGNISLASNLKKTVTRNIDKTLVAYDFKPANKAVRLTHRFTVRN